VPRLGDTPVAACEQLLEQPAAPRFQAQRTRELLAVGDRS
jgi:hypothetical protein